MDSSNSNLYPSNNDSVAREKLITLRLALLRLHKTLLEMERRDYEREHGHVNTGELFRLVVDHAQFAWLHNISESGDTFKKKYFVAIQRDPAVVIEHAELARLFNNEPPDSATP